MEGCFVTPPRVAIAGTRSLADPALGHVRAYVLGLPDGTTVVSGDGGAVDRTAVAVARCWGYPVRVHRAKWRPGGPGGPVDRSAGPRRNAEVERDSDRLAAFWDGVSPGTGDTIERFKRAGKRVEVYGLDGRRVE